MQQVQVMRRTSHVVGRLLRNAALPVVHLHEGEAVQHGPVPVGNLFRQSLQQQQIAPHEWQGASQVLLCYVEKPCISECWDAIFRPTERRN